MPGTATVLGAGDVGGATFGTASATRFFPLNTGHLIASSTVNNTKTITRAAGDFSRLGGRVITNGRSTTSTLKLQKNGTDGNNAAAIAASTTGWFEDATPHTDAVVDGDTINGALTNSTGTGSIVMTSVTVKFMADSGAVAYYGWYASGDSAGITALRITANSATTFLPLGGASHNTAGAESTETNQSKVKLRAVGTLSNVQCIVITNGRSTTCTLRQRKNGANGNQNVSIPASTTGTFEDPSNTDSVAAADTANYAVDTSTGGGNLDLVLIACKFASFGSAQDIVSGTTQGASGLGSTSNPNYWTLFGDGHVTATEINAKTRLPYAATASFMRCFVSQGNSGALTAVLRKNGADANQTFSIGSGATGVFEDASNTDSIADGDDLDYSTGALASVFAFSIKWWAMTIDPGGGGSGGGGSSRTRRYNTVILGG